MTSNDESQAKFSKNRRGGRRYLPFAFTEQGQFAKLGLGLIIRNRRKLKLSEGLGAKSSTVIGYRYLRFRPKLLYYSRVSDERK